MGYNGTEKKINNTSIAISGQRIIWSYELITISYINELFPSTVKRWIPFEDA